MKIRGTTISTPMKPEAAMLKCKNLTEEQQAQIRKNLGIKDVLLVYITDNTATHKSGEIVAHMASTGTVICICGTNVLAYNGVEQKVADGAYNFFIHFKTANDDEGAWTEYIIDHKGSVTTKAMSNGGSGGSVDTDAIIDKCCPSFTESGAVVACEPVADYPLHIVSSINPVQEGSGDPSPDKWEDANSLYEYRIDDTEAAYKIPNGGTYKVTVQSDVQITGIGVNLESYDSPVTGVLNGNTFLFDMPDGYTGEVWIKANSAADEYEVDFNLQKFVPGNVRPITGHTGVTIRHYNCKNHIDDTVYDTNYWSEADGSAYYKQYPIPKLIPGKQYTLSIDSAGGLSSPYFNLQKLTTNATPWATMSFLWTGGGTDGYKTYTFTAEDTDYRFWINSILVVPKIAYIQLEEGSVATEYEPHSGDTFTIDLGQSVYGGSLDWQTGVLTIDRQIYTVDEKTVFNKANGGKMVLYSSQNPFLTNASFSTTASIKDNKLLCSHLPTASYSSVNNGGYGISGHGTSITLCCEQSVENPDGFVAMMDGAQIVFGLVTPITIQLTPQEIIALSGTNTIYSDTGDTTVSGKADPTAVIEKLTNAIIALGGNV